MKNMIRNTLLVGLAVARFAMSQEQTLLQDVHHGGFGSYTLQGTRIDGHSRLFTGMKGAWIINHSLYLGIGGYGMIKGIDAPADTAGNAQYLQMGYGGALIGYTILSDKLVHFNVESLIGAGGYVLSDGKWDEHENDCDEECKHDMIQPFFAWEPRVGVEVNVTKFMRVSAGVGYRLIVQDEAKNGFSDSDLGGPVGSIDFKFGRF